MTQNGTFISALPAKCCIPPERCTTAICFAIVLPSSIAVSAPSKCNAAPTCLHDRFLAISTKTPGMSPAPSPRPRLSRNHATIASVLRCCSRISSASCGLAGFGCAAHVVRKMSLRWQPSRRTSDGLQNLSFDLHQRRTHVSRNHADVRARWPGVYRSQGGGCTCSPKKFGPSIVRNRNRRLLQQNRH